MIEQLVILLPLSQAALWTGFAVFVRVGAILSVMPGFGDQTVPVRVRLVLSFMFTLVVAPAVADQIGPMPTSQIGFTVLLLPEVLAGLFFGIVLRFFVFALQIAGSIAAQSTSLSQIFGGSAGADPQPAIAHLYVVAGTALAALMGLHVQAAAYMISGYAMVPFGTLLDAETLLSVGLGEAGRAFGLGFTLAAPFVIASLLYNVVLGVINRAMPQLMVSFVGAPAITAGGLALLLISAPALLGLWIVAFQDFMASPFGPWP